VSLGGAVDHSSRGRSSRSQINGDDIQAVKQSFVKLT
jgi:hypothetical protein